MQIGGNTNLVQRWLAPNVGIVKFIRVSADSKVKKSLELTQYEIKSTGSGSEQTLRMRKIA